MLAAAFRAACDGSEPHSQPRIHEGRAKAFAAADEADQHVGGHVDTRPAQVDRAPVGNELVDGVEHRLADIAPPDLELSVDLAGHRERRMKRGREQPTVDQTATPS